MLNFLIHKAYAVGTLTSADTETVLLNWIDELTANLPNMKTLLVAMIVISIFGWVIHRVIRAFTSPKTF